MSIEELLEQLYVAEQERNAIESSKQLAVDEVITPIIKQRLNEIDVEFSPLFSAIDGRITSLTEEIKKLAVGIGQSIKSAHKQAVFTPGRVTWDAKGLDGVASLLPEIMKFRKVGEPSISIRSVKEK